MLQHRQVDADGLGNLGRERHEKIKGYSMPIITCVFHFGEKTSEPVQVNCFNGNNAANSIESAIRKTFKEMQPENPGMVLVKSFKCKDINNGLDLHDYENRIINEDDLNSGKIYHFDVNAIFTKSDFGGRRRRTRKSRKSRKSRRR
jgi:hypothetical protein